MKNKLRTLKNEIKANIANGIWKVRPKFWNDSIKFTMAMWYTDRLVAASQIDESWPNNLNII